MKDEGGQQRRTSCRAAKNIGPSKKRSPPASRVREQHAAPCAARWRLARSPWSETIRTLLSRRRESSSPKSRADAGHDAGLVVTMDADLTHQPEKIPRLFAALQTLTANAVIGSRAVPGPGVRNACLEADVVGYPELGACAVWRRRPRQHLRVSCLPGRESRLKGCGETRI